MVFFYSDNLFILFSSVLPKKGVGWISYFPRRHGHVLAELYQGGDADPFRRRHFQRVGHAVEIIVRFGVDETEPAPHIPCFQGLDIVYAAAMPCQTAMAKSLPG